MPSLRTNDSSKSSGRRKGRLGREKQEEWWRVGNVSPSSLQRSICFLLPGLPVPRTELLTPTIINACYENENTKIKSFPSFLVVSELFVEGADFLRVYTAAPIGQCELRSRAEISRRARSDTVELSGAWKCSLGLLSLSWTSQQLLYKIGAKPVCSYNRKKNDEQLFNKL